MPAAERGSYFGKITREVIGVDAYQRDMQGQEESNMGFGSRHEPNRFSARFVGFVTALFPLTGRLIQYSVERETAMSERKVAAVCITSMVSDIGVGALLPLFTGMENPAAGVMLKTAYNISAHVIYDAATAQNNTTSTSR